MHGTRGNASHPPHWVRVSQQIAHDSLQMAALHPSERGSQSVNDGRRFPSKQPDSFERFRPATFDRRQGKREGGTRRGAIEFCLKNRLSGRAGDRQSVEVGEHTVVEASEAQEVDVRQPKERRARLGETRGFLRVRSDDSIENPLAHSVFLL
jgi:hypothetical protein